MNTRLAQLVTRCYPRAWRERYGAEFVQFLADNPRHGPGAAFNVVGAALREHLFPTTLRAGMAGGSVLWLARRPSAILPMILSLAALLLLLGFLFLANRGVIPLHSADGDEGFAARLWQLLMVSQLPIITWFGLRFLWRRPVQAVVILAVQSLLALASIVPIFILES